MGYTIYESGKTGPSANIGGSSEYHIDSKFSTSLGAEKARRMFEEKVKKYNSLGRNVEFSNSGVSGLVYDMSLPDEERAAVFDRAHKAHAARDGWYSLDYYAPTIGNDRYHKSAEGAPIFAIGLEDGRRETGTGGNYGFHSMMYDSNGALVAKVGHGDDRYPEAGDGQSLMPQADGSPTAPTSTPSPANYADMSASQMNAEYDKMRMAGDVFKAQEAGMAMHKAHFGKR